MIDKTRILEAVRERLDRLPIGHHLELRTYKRNRGVVIVKRSDDELLVLEQGYEMQRFTLPPSKLDKLLKKLLRREFPRSTKIRLYEPGEWTEEKALDRPRKII